MFYIIYKGTSDVTCCIFEANQQPSDHQPKPQQAKDLIDICKFGIIITGNSNKPLICHCSIPNRIHVKVLYIILNKTNNKHSLDIE